MNLSKKMPMRRQHLSNVLKVSQVPAQRHLGEKLLDRGDSRWKGPELGSGLVCSKNNKAALWLGVEWRQGKLEMKS